MKIWSWTLRRRRRLGALGLLAFAACAYAAILLAFDVVEHPREGEYGVPLDKVPAAIYVQPISVDPLNSALQLRISVMSMPPGRIDSSGVRMLLIQSGRQIEQIPVTLSQSRPEVTIGVDLDGGDVHDYPLDRFVSQLRLTCVERSPGEPDVALPIHVTTWEAVFGFVVTSETIGPADPIVVDLRLNVRRSGAVRFFGIAVYLTMIVLTLCALTIATLVFLGVRRIEVTLMGALIGVVFALPALRNALPGTPPLGVLADVLVFFWAEFGAVLALCLVVVAWSRRGAKP